MKKHIMVLIAAVLICQTAFAVDVSELVSAALQNSPKIGQIEKTRENSLLDASKLKGMTYAVTVSGTQPVYSSAGTYIPSSDFAVTYTDSENNLEVSGTLSSSALRLDGDPLVDRNGNRIADYSLSATAGVAKTFEFKDWDTTDLTTLIRNTRAELTYQTSMLNFRKTLLNDIIAIVETKEAIVKAEKALEDAVDSYDSKLRTGELVQDSVLQMQGQVEIDRLRQTLSSQNQKLESLLSSFENDYGFAFFDFDSVQDAVFDFDFRQLDGNSTVYLAQLALRSAQQALDEKTRKGSSLKLNADLGPSVNFITGSGYDSTDLAMSTGMTYTNGNFSVKGSVSEKLDNWSWTTPTVTISGSWSDGRIKSESERIEIAKLENEVYFKQSDLADAEYAFGQSLKSLERSAESLRASAAQLEIEADYHNRILDNTQLLYEKGFTTQAKLDSARSDVEDDRIQDLILRLRALVLQTEIMILGL